MTRERTLAIALLAVLATPALAGCVGLLSADGPGTLGAPEDDGTEEEGNASEPREGPAYHDDRHDPRRLSADLFRPQPPGTVEELSIDFGPFVVGPGHDHNRLRVEAPADGGFVTQVSVRMIDPVTGREPSHVAMHLHHGHWWDLEEDPAEPDGPYPVLEWRWGSGDERTRGNLTAVADADPEGPRYGVFLEPGRPQLVNFALHNRMPTARSIVVRLEMVFVHGTAEGIAAADGCDGAPEDAGCRAGETFHGLETRVWGGRLEVPREPDGDGTYVWPPENPRGRRWYEPGAGHPVGSPWDGEIVLGAGHIHQNGKAVVVANLGPPGSGCTRDVDDDGWPGVTIYRSRTESVPAKAWPHSSEFQVTATQPGWRAPIREADRLTLFATYANRDQAEEDAMALAGIYVDPQAEPRPANHTGGCDVEALRPQLVGGARPAPGYTISTRDAHHAPGPVCNRGGLGADLPDEARCNRPVDEVPDRVPARTVHIEGFRYTPGDLDAAPPGDRIPVVTQGETLTWVNHDAKAHIRHTVTSCRWPCNGPMTLNYPQSSGRFDSDKIGNLDPGSEGANGPEDLPAWQLDTSDLEPGLYAYHCRIHPWMRGWFEVASPEGTLLDM